MGCCRKRAERVAAGKTDFDRKSGSGDLKRMRFVMIDEYQDFSELFYRLMDAVRKQNPQARFFCVGDDWQAINGFAGSDLRFFQNFEKLFDNARTLPVATNYRSAQSIVDVGNALMRGHGTPARAHTQRIGKVEIADLATFAMTTQEIKDHSDDRLISAVLRLVHKAVNNNQSVLLLSRKKTGLPWNSHFKTELDQFLELLRSHLPENRIENVDILTAHKSKGLQGKVVIVLDAVPQCYPLIHPDSIFTRIFESTVERVTAEERRLFYVALTRAEENLVIFTETDSVSPFLEDLEKKMHISRLDWSDYPASLSPLSEAIITIKVRNQASGFGKGTYAIKNVLKAEGYRWDPDSKAWSTIELASGFSSTEFQNKAKWANDADGIEVQIYDYSDEEIERYHVDYGFWTPVAIYRTPF